MAENSNIQWTTHTFNPWRGCTKVAAGCANCYAETMSKRNQKTLGIWGPNGTRVVASEAMWREPVKWNQTAVLTCVDCGRSAQTQCAPKGVPPVYNVWDFECECGGCEYEAERPRVFCASLADVFEDWKGHVCDSKGPRLHVAPSGLWRPEGLGCPVSDYGWEPLTLGHVRFRLANLWDATPNLNWLVLTKRPENIRRMLCDVDDPPKHGTCTQESKPPKRRGNVWLGTSVACRNDLGAIDELRKCGDLAKLLFVSIEPLLEDLGSIDLRGISWVIAGGESGPNARPCDINWIRDVARQCGNAGVATFVKQWGSNPHYTNHQGDMHACGPIRDPKGGDPEEWPEDVRIREIPA